MIPFRQKRWIAMSPWFRFLGMFVPLVALSTMPARANYTGNDFTLVTSPYTTSDHVTVQLEFLAALAADLPLGAVTPVSFSFNDGHQTITSPAFNAFIELATDAGGNISGWDLGVCGDITCLPQIVTRHTGADTADVGQLIPQGVQEGRVIGNAGVWTSSVPEPSGMAVGAIGLAGLGWVRRRRQQAPTTLAEPITEGR